MSNVLRYSGIMYYYLLRKTERMSQPEYDQIEEMVRARKATAATVAIKQALGRRKGDPDTLFRACDWYRRLGAHRIGFQLVSPQEPLKKIESTDSFIGKRFLWAARFMNLLGASPFAISLIEQVRPVTAEDHRIAGNIFLSNFDHSRALKHFRDMVAKEPNPDTYLARLSLLGLADCHANLAEAESAIKLADQIFCQSREPLLRGIALQAKGEYLVRMNAIPAALDSLQSAVGYFPAADQSVDSGFLYKWLGYVRVKLGKIQAGNEAFNYAEKILRKPEYRPETWLDLFRLKHELGLLSEAESSRLYWYPGLPSGFRRTLKPLDSGCFGIETAPLRIALSREEFMQQGKRFYGLPIEVRLIANLAITGKWGLPAIRALSLLWPGEVYSFRYLKGRLDQLLLRIRNSYLIQARERHGLISVPDSDLRKIFCVSESALFPSFLDGHRFFRAAEVSHYYSIAKTQRSGLLKTWLSHGWVTRSGKGKNAKYCSSQ